MGDKIFRPSLPALGPTHPPAKLVPGLSRSKVWPGRATDHSPLLVPWSWKSRVVPLPIYIYIYTHTHDYVCVCVHRSFHSTKSQYKRTVDIFLFQTAKSLHAKQKFSEFLKPLRENFSSKSPDVTWKWYPVLRPPVMEKINSLTILSLRG